MLKRLVTLAAVTSSLVAHADTLRLYTFLSGGSLIYDVDMNSFIASTPSSTGLLPGEISFQFDGIIKHYQGSVPTLGFESFNPANANDPLGGINYYTIAAPATQCTSGDQYGNCFLYGLADPGPMSYSLQGSAFFYAPSVTLDLIYVAPIPEPSSFALLGTGLLGVAGVMKRRFV